MHNGAGDLVYVPPGWAHCVFNVQPCLKFAWDFFVDENLPQYFKSHKRHATLKVKGDYSRIQEILLQKIENM